MIHHHLDNARRLCATEIGILIVRKRFIWSIIHIARQHSSSHCHFVSDSAICKFVVGKIDFVALKCRISVLVVTCIHSGVAGNSAFAWKFANLDPAKLKPIQRPTWNFGLFIICQYPRVSQVWLNFIRRGSIGINVNIRFWIFSWLFFFSTTSTGRIVVQIFTVVAQTLQYCPRKYLSVV